MLATDKIEEVLETVRPAIRQDGGDVELIAHLPGSQFVLPLNAVTSLIGAPIVIWFVLHRKNLSQAFS